MTDITRSKSSKPLYLIVLSGMVCILCLSIGQAQVSVLTQHNDISRTGANLQETTLNTSNVNVTSFGRLGSYTVDGNVYAQPLYVPNLTINGATHNVLFVATEHNSVYAFDADDPTAPPFWQNMGFGTPVPSADICTVAPADFCPYTDLVPEIGITSTPVIDTTSGIIYVVAKSKDNNTYHYKLHALDITTGQARVDLGSPVEISATVSGTGDGGSTVSFNALTEMNRPGLLLANGNVYMGFGSVGDVPVFRGWVLGYSAQTLVQVAKFCTTPNSTGGGLWSTGNGLNADANGDLYVVTGNGGTFDANSGGKDFSSAYIKLRGSDLMELDYFAPNNWSTLNQDNTDLSSGGVVLVPGGQSRALLVGGGKDGIFRVMDTTTGSMGQEHSANMNLQNFTATNPPIFGSPIYWNAPTSGTAPISGPAVYLWGQVDVMQAWSLNTSTNQFNQTPVSAANIVGVGHNNGDGVNTAAASLSANGSTAGTGIIWAATPFGPSGCDNPCDANPGPVPGALYAFDATDLSSELWDSQMNPSRDGVGNYAKFVPPTIANGKVYLATFSNQIAVYGLFSPPDFAVSGAPSSQSVAPGSSAQYIVQANESGGFTGTVNLSCNGTGVTCSLNPTSVTIPQSPTSTLTASAATAGNYTITVKGISGSVTHTTTVALTVQGTPVPGFTMASTALSPATVAKGGTATSTITITGQNGLDPNTVSLSCSVTGGGTPAPACSLSAVSGGKSTLTITTTAATASLRSPTGVFYAMFLPIGGLTLLGAGVTTRKKKLLGIVVLCIMVAGLIFLTACGGGSSPGGGGGNGGTPSGTYTVTVTGTATGATTQSTTVTLTVQ